MGLMAGGIDQPDLVSTQKNIGPVTVTDQLTQRKQLLEAELTRVNAALDALAKNPGVEEILNLVSKAVYGSVRY